jgi:hypothetical protein
MMVSAERSAPHPIALTTLHTVNGTALSCPVGSLHPRGFACEWSTVRCCMVALYCSDMSTCLIGHDGTACPHVLQAIMIQVSDALEIRVYALETYESSRIGKSVMSFFIYETSDSLGIVGHMIVSEPFLPVRWGPEP